MQGQCVSIPYAVLVPIERKAVAKGADGFFLVYYQCKFITKLTKRYVWRSKFIPYQYSEHASTITTLSFAFLNTWSSPSFLYMCLHFRDMRIQFGSLLADIGIINLPKKYQVQCLCREYFIINSCVAFNNSILALPPACNLMSCLNSCLLLENYQH